MERVEQMPPRRDEPDPVVPPGYRARKLADAQRDERIAIAVRRINGPHLADNAKLLARVLNDLDSEFLVAPRTREQLLEKLCMKHGVPKVLRSEVGAVVSMMQVLLSSGDDSPDRHRTLIDGILAKAGHKYRRAPGLVGNPWDTMLDRAEVWRDVTSKRGGARMPDYLTVVRGILLSESGKVTQRWLSQNCAAYASFYRRYLLNEYTYRDTSRTTQFFVSNFVNAHASLQRRLFSVELRESVQAQLTPEMRERILLATAPPQ